MDGTTSSKPTLGIFSINSCGGCVEQLLNADTLLVDLADQVDIVYWQRLMDTQCPEHVDIAVVEGAVASERDLDYLGHIRDIADNVVALGMCACGLNRNEDEREYKPLHSHIDVDYRVRCCPVDALDFIKVIQKVIYRNNTFESTAALCGVCRANEIECVFDCGKLCAGLVTQVSCDAICTRLGSTCFGCSGVSPNAQIETASSVFAHAKSSSTLDEFLEACNVDRLLSQETGGLDIEKSTFVSSRRCGRHSHNRVVEHLRSYERDNGLQVAKRCEDVRDALVQIEAAKNNISDLYFEDLRMANGFDSFLEFYKSNPELGLEFLETRLTLNTALSEISGRAVHPITLTAGGFTTPISEDVLTDVREDLLTILDFAIRSVDFANELWKNTTPKDETPALTHVLAIWNDMSEEARFAAAKAGLRAPEDDSRRECVAKAVAVIDYIRGAIDKLSL